MTQCFSVEVDIQSPGNIVINLRWSCTAKMLVIKGIIFKKKGGDASEVRIGNVLWSSLDLLLNLTLKKDL